MIPTNLLSLFLLTATFSTPAASSEFAPYGFQSGRFTNPTDSSTTDAESINDDSFAGGMYYDPLRSLLYFTGMTYGRYFDGSEGSDAGGNSAHLANGDCFLGVLKLPREGDDPNWLLHDGDSGAKLIYARRLGTPQNSEACSAIQLISQVEDGLVDQSENKLKLALLGHVNPTPLSSADLNGRALKDAMQELNDGYDMFNTNDTSTNTRLLYDKNKGGFFSSLSKSDPITESGRAYGFVADIDIELKQDKQNNYNTANTALLGGYVLESSPLVYPVAMTQSRRDPDLIYVVSMHADEEVGGSEGVLNQEYSATIQMESDASLRMRPDLTLGGAGGNGADLVGGVPKYGDGFYVKVQQLSVTPYEQLMDVEPTASEKIKATMSSGWGFGFKLNDAKDVRPSCVEFIKGKTPDDDLILLAGTTRKDGKNGYTELDGFVTKLIPPAPSPVPDYTVGSTVEDVGSESKNVKRIDSTTGRDETVTGICLPPPNPKTGTITHAFVVGSIANSVSESNPSGKDPSLAYILMMKLEDMSTIWKQRIPSIHPNGIGGDVLGEGCAVSPDGTTVYLAGTIDGGSALNTGSKNNLSNPSDPNSAPVTPIGGVSDVFVVSYDVVFGNINWAKQFGTVHEDKLARGGGVTVDNEGNVIVMGSSRGPLQRYRPSETANRKLQTEQRLASDIFVMSLSEEDGKLINAPYISSSIDAANGASFISTAGAGISPGGIAGIVITSVCFICACVVLIFRRGKKRRKSSSSGVAERMWDRNIVDDYSFDNSGIAGYRDRSIGGRRGSGNGTVDGLRIIRGMQDDEWDDGTDRISKSASWMKDQNRSYIKKKSEENSSFLRSLRDEANVTMSKMFKESDATDPRLDDGASIKSLLSHYREVRKSKLISGEGSKQAGDENEMKESSKLDIRSHPPPPPPRKDGIVKKSSIGGDSADGLAEFTIV